MPETAGKYSALSSHRTLVADLLHFCGLVPAAVAERRMRLGPLVAARAACSPRPNWSAIFVKAYSLVAARTPVLRTAFLAFPWGRLYEHPSSVASVNIDRTLAGERVVLQALIPRPESLPLRDIEADIRRHQEAAPAALPSCRRAARLARVPWPVRRWVWWAALNVFGSMRCDNFGTFGLTSLGAFGACITQLPILLTSHLHYGILAEDGGLDVRLSFDHRVLDGAMAAQALSDLEGSLLGEVADECRALAAGGAGPVRGGSPSGHSEGGRG